MEFYEKNIGTTDEGEPIIRAIAIPETEKCQSCQGVNEQHSDTCLAVVDQFYTYSCGVCGKDSTIPKDGSVSPSHYTRCIRIGMPTYWGQFVDDFIAEDNS